MSKIKKWHRVRQEHQLLVEQAKKWLESDGIDGPLEVNMDTRYTHIVDVGRQVLRIRRADLYREMIEYSRECVAAAAREALAECEQIRADAAMDVESIEEGE
jgi:hypothetical protein